MSTPRQTQVSPDEAGQKLLQFLQRRAPGVPRGAIMRWIRTGQVRVDGGRKKPFDRLAAGQMVRIPPHAADPEAPARTDLPPLPIVHRGEGWVAVAKPAGLPAHGGTGHADSVDARLKAMFAGADFTPALAHRLDRDTSGLLLAGTSYAGLRRLQEQLGGKGAAKTYVAWARGVWAFGSGPVAMDDRLAKQGADGRERMARTDDGKPAHALAQCLRTTDDASLLAVRLGTGRTHQIRAQLALRGHPVAGDFKYGGGRENELLPAPILLHSCAVTIDGVRIRLAPEWPCPWAVTNEDLQAITDP